MTHHDRAVTIVATVVLPERGSVAAEAAAVERLELAVRDAIVAEGAELIPCGWAPDPDTIADAVDTESVEVLDLNPGC